MPFAPRENGEQRGYNPRQGSGGEGCEVIPHGLDVAVVRHCAEQASEVLFIHQVDKVLASAVGGFVEPPCRQGEGCDSESEHLAEGGEETVAAQEPVDAYHEAWEQRTYRAFCEHCARQQHPGCEPSQAPAACALVANGVQEVHCPYHAGGEYHVEPTGYSGSEHLNAGGCDEGEYKAEADSPLARCPRVSAHHHGYHGDG